MIELRPVSIRQANALVSRWHRHHKPVHGARFAIGAFVAGLSVGAVIVGRPVAPGLDDGLTFEVVRLVTDGTAHVASRLLGAAWRASKAMGVRRMVSYIRHDEKGTCYHAAGWRSVAVVDGRGWTTGNKTGRWLPGMYEPRSEIVDRVRWEIAA